MNSLLRMADNPFFTLLAHATIQTCASQEEFIDLLRDLEARKIKQPRVKNILLLLAQHRELESLPRFLDRLRDVAETKGYLTFARVTTATPLTDHELASLQKHLHSMFATPVLLTQQTDPRVQGGLRIDTRDTRFDATIKGRIHRLTQHLNA